MDSNDNSSSKAEASQLSGGLTQLQGTIESFIGNITGAESWKVAGQQAQSAGAQEVEEAQEKASKEAREERLHGKIDSLKGMIFGDAEKQSRGNIEAEKAEWKQAVKGRHELPEVSSERIDAKVKTAVGMITGNKEQQNEGNREAEKAEWLHG
ncbi:hypothetical protein TWF696_005490 [Orbilia brochopaga]|uniref:CsbD-like domain-containing protein n=1 Tax=Orbilia brochopaga TaxID=3140254 RepID=A0AAV9V0X7_9PEZI